MRNIVRGIIMGVTDLIPGISGGTIAMVLGIYHELIASINGILTRNWRRHVLFIAPILLGIGVALLTFSRLIEWLISNHSYPLFFFFNGLILGIVPFLLRTANYKTTFKGQHYVLLAVAAALVIATGIFRENDMQTIWTSLSMTQYLYLFIAGWLASTAMILPGISGSFIFLLLGVYPTVINGISSFNVSILIVVALGIGLGLILTSKLIQFLFSKFQALTYAAMIGLVIGSLIVTFPGIPLSVGYSVLCIAMFALGATIAILLGRYEHNNSLNKAKKAGA